MVTYMHQKIWTRMITVGIVIKAWNWEWLKCSSMVEAMNELWCMRVCECMCICMMEYYTLINTCYCRSASHKQNWVKEGRCKRDTVNNLYKILKQAKIIYSDKSQNSSYLCVCVCVCVCVSEWDRQRQREREVGSR